MGGNSKSNQSPEVFRLLGVGGLAILLLCSPSKGQVRPDAAPKISDFVLYAERSIKMGERSHAEGADVGVRTSVVPLRGGAAQLRIGEHVKCRNVYSPSTSLENDAEVR